MLKNHAHEYIGSYIYQVQCLHCAAKSKIIAGCRENVSTN